MRFLSNRRHRAGLRIGFEMISAGGGFSPGVGGMISYYDGLLRELCTQQEVDSIVVFVSPWNRSLSVPHDPKIELVVCRALPRNRGGRVAYEQTVLPLLAMVKCVDVLLCTVNVIPLLRRSKTVVVLQSIQYFLWPEQLGRVRRTYLEFFTPRSLRKADRVITVTDAERDDTLELFSVDPDRVVTVYHGVPPWAEEALGGTVSTEPFHLPSGEPYVLIISRLYHHKNHPRLIQAFALLLQNRNLPHHLVVVGGDADLSGADLEELARGAGIADRVHALGVMPQNEIPGLLSGASAVAYPSLYETFGLPVLETFAFRVPLVTSRTGATAEVAGGAARLVDPTSAQSIAEGLLDVLVDAGLRDRLVKAGSARVKEFSWERCAVGTLHVLQKASNRDNSPPGSTVRSRNGVRPGR